MKQHKHAAVIHAWADGAEIEYQSELGGQWHPYAQGDFSGRGEYRVKPEKVYPVTRLEPEQLRAEYNSDFQGTSEQAALVRVVNFALRHAIDSGQVVVPDQGCIEWRNPRLAEAEGVLAQAAALFAPDRRARRDMAIAEAMRQVAKACACPVTSPVVFRMIDKLDLAAIIANVKD